MNSSPNEIEKPDGKRRIACSLSLFRARNTGKTGENLA
jgi:hypothetical protein